MNAEWLQGKKVKAREWWKCDMCGGDINVGDIYDWQRIWIRGSHDWDGDWTEGHFKYLHCHNHDCVTPIECQRGNHTFVYQQGRGQQDDFFSDYQQEGTFCTACGMDKDEYDTEQAKFTENKNLNR